jgi:hypothetical protein
MLLARFSLELAHKIPDLHSQPLTACNAHVLKFDYLCKIKMSYHPELVQSFA